MMRLVASLAVGAGLAFLVTGILLRARERVEQLAAILQLPGGEHDVAEIEQVSESRLAFFEPGVRVANAFLERLRVHGSLRVDLERARLPIRPGEFVLAAAGLGVLGALLVWLLTGQAVIGAPVLVAAPWLAWKLGVKRRIERRRRAGEEQLPEALSLIAGSLEAGHTFLRAIEMLVEECEPPLSEEFSRVIAETRLGDPLVDALERMATRLEIADLTWVVQAIRIQQTVGGRLADLLSTLAEFMRSRQEIRREVQVLTAEGRLSAYVLGGLPIAVGLLLQMMSPSYLRPMFEGWRPLVLLAAAASVGTGIVVIKRMARIDV